MRNKVLYFPYIDVPNSVWFTRILLYWDEVGAIVPYNFIKRPNKLDRHTRSLVRSYLVKQVIPGMHLHRIPNFRSSFLDYIESLGRKLEERRRAFRLNLPIRNCSKVHIEKMESIGDALVEIGLAKNNIYPWYYVETETANEFMTYLAATLGNLNELSYIPVTDSLKHLEQFANSSSPDLEAETQISNLRIEVLENLFPAPSKPLSAQEIEAFKSKHGDLLSDFRRYVEREIVTIADINDEALKQRRVSIFKSEIDESIKSIHKYLDDFGYRHVTLGKIGSVVAAIPGVSNIFSLASAVYNAFASETETIADKKFLYAALAQREILMNG